MSPPLVSVVDWNHEKMKNLILFLICLCAASSLRAQAPLSRRPQAPLSRFDALRQLYRNYDPEKNTAQWDCPKEQNSEGPHTGWLCWAEYSPVSVEVLLMAEVGEDETYLVASAKPAHAPAGYDCHACAPAIGVAVFAAREGKWTLQSANPAVGFYGGWGAPPDINLVNVGLGKRGLLLSTEGIAQGFAWSSKVLLMPVGTTVAEVWSIQDEQDNSGAYDPDDKPFKQVPYRSSAAIRFYIADPNDADSSGYDEIEVISRGNSSKDLVHLKPENWTEIYHFKDGKYKLLSRKEFVEAKKPAPKPKVKSTP